MLKKKSDWKLLSLSNYGQTQDFELDDWYRICAATANAGAEHPYEKNLNPNLRILNQVRRALKTEDTLSAKRFLTEVTGNDPIVLGDKAYLSAMLDFRDGDLQKSKNSFLESAAVFGKAGQEYRYLRAMINSVMLDPSISKHLMHGEVYFLEQEARRLEFFELIGNIQRARALTLFSQDRLTEALEHVRLALEAYQIDGSPNDLSSSFCLMAILHFLNGNRKNAYADFSKALDRSGKSMPYVEVFQALENGKIPNPPSGHPLAAVDYSKYLPKTESISTKILRALEKAPMTREELVTTAWGSKANNPSYIDRLHSCIRILRKEGHFIAYDGEMYRLGNTSGKI
jgi:tetratricopeptide (TPR) repeat protein